MYSSKRYERVSLMKSRTLEATERLLLENYQDVLLDDLATELDIAKGTIYKYFNSKNQLYLELLILNEQRLLDISKSYKNNIKESIEKYMLYHMLNANRTVLFYNIEERIASQEWKLKKLFDTLYQIRETRILELKEITAEYLQLINSTISVRDYLSYVWTITYGACLLLSSTYYQKSIGERKKLMDFYINNALDI
ncbi:TetR/AcrR family transcriptional regulator [Acinetobacter pittii]